MLVTKRMHPPVTHQGDVKRSASGKETHHLSTPTKKLTPKSKLKMYFKWKIGKINVKSVSDDFRVHFLIEECKETNLGAVCMQDVHGHGYEVTAHL